MNDGSDGVPASLPFKLTSNIRSLTLLVDDEERGGNEPLVAGCSAGLSANLPVTLRPTPPSPILKHDMQGRVDFSPLKMHVDNPMEFSEVLKSSSGNLYSIDKRLDPQRIPFQRGFQRGLILGERLDSHAPSTSTQEEFRMGGFWKAIPFYIPDRINSFLRNSMINSNEIDRWASLIRALETLKDFGSSRDKVDANTCLGYASRIPIPQSGKLMNRQVVWGRSISLSGCCIQDVCISDLYFTVVDYGDNIPTSVELQRILGYAQDEEKNQCVILHLAAGLVHVEMGSNYPLPLAKRIKSMATSLRLMEVKQACEVQVSTSQSSSKWKKRAIEPKS